MIYLFGIDQWIFCREIFWKCCISSDRYGSWNSSDLCVWNDLAVRTDALNIYSGIVCRSDSIPSRRCGKDCNCDRCGKCSEEISGQSKSFAGIKEEILCMKKKNQLTFWMKKHKLFVVKCNEQN